MNTKMAEILNLSALQKNTAEQDIKTNPQYCLATTKNKEMRKIFMDIIKNKPQELFLAISDANKIVSYLEDKSLSKEQNISKEIEEMEMEYA